MTQQFTHSSIRRGMGATFYVEQPRKHNVLKDMFNTLGIVSMIVVTGFVVAVVILVCVL